jgi:hypothetical protein
VGERAGGVGRDTEGTEAQRWKDRDRTERNTYFFSSGSFLLVLVRMQLIMPLNKGRMP